MEALVPLIFAITGLPALGIAAWYARSGTLHDRGTALRWALIALSILLSAVCMYFAHNNKQLQTYIVIGMVVAVNALVVSMVMHLRRSPSGKDRQ